MSENTPKAVTNDPELGTGDFSDTSKQPPAPVASTGSAESEVTSEAADTRGVDDLQRVQSDTSGELQEEYAKPDPTTVSGLGGNHPEHLEPFWVPLPYRKAQKRDTVIFGISAIVTIVAGAAALAYFDPFGGSLSGPSWLGPTAAALAGLGALGLLVFGIFALVDLSKSERAYYGSTHDWLLNRYGLDISKHKVKGLSKHRNSLGGVTGWKRVALEGYPQGVQITYTERYGYRLITTVDNVESQLPRAGR